MPKEQALSCHLCKSESDLVVEGAECECLICNAVELYQLNIEFDSFESFDDEFF